MVTTCTSFWSFLSPRGPLAANGDNMHHFLVFFVTARSSSSPWWQHAHLFGLFCHCEVLQQPMVTTCTSFGLFCHHEVLQQPMVTACTSLWSFLSPRGPPAANGDNMHHFFGLFVTARFSSSPWWQYAPLFGLFWHCEVNQQPIITACTIFWSFLSPWGPLAAHGDNMHHFLVSSVTVRYIKQPMVTACTTFWFFLSLWGLAPDHGDSIDKFLDLSVTARLYHSSWWQNRPLSSPFCHCKYILHPMLTASVAFWSFMSPRGLSTAHGDSTDHFLVLSVTASTFCSQCWIWLLDWS